MSNEKKSNITMKKKATNTVEKMKINKIKKTTAVTLEIDEKKLNCGKRIVNCNKLLTTKMIKIKKNKMSLSFD